MEGATALHAHLCQLSDGPEDRTAVVVGAGFTGLEVATELSGRLDARLAEGDGSAERGRVVLIERANVVGPDLGPGPRPAIVAALGRLGIDVRLGKSIASVSPRAVRLVDVTEIPPRRLCGRRGCALAR